MSDNGDYDILVSALAKMGQSWVIVCKVETVGQAVRQLGNWAANHELAFNWHDAALLARSLQKNAAGTPGADDQM